MIDTISMHNKLNDVVGNVNYLQKILKQMVKNNEIHDFLVHPEDDIISIYYSLESNSNNFFRAIVAKES